MIDLLAGELMKLRTTRMVWGLLGGLLVIVTIGAFGLVFGTAKAQLAQEGEQANLFGTASTGIIFVLLLGVMLLSGEFRHGTITQTLLITPNRWHVLGAKLLAAVVLGLAFGAAAELLSFVVGAPLIELRGVGFIFGSDARDLVLGTILATAACGPLGVAIGSLIRNQVVAIVVVFAGFLIAEPIVAALLEIKWDEPSKYLPVHVISGVVGDEANAPSRGASLAVLAAYVGVLAAVGGRFVLSRDVNSIQA